MPRFMYSIRLAFLLSLLCFPLAAQTPGPNQPGDPRNIKNGSVIPDEGYSAGKSLAAQRLFERSLFLFGCQKREYFSHKVRSQAKIIKALGDVS